jgi:hypothetical protein
MRVYLDNCCFNRPFDDQASLTVRLETEAKLDIQNKIRGGEIDLGWSYILDLENHANPFLDRYVETLRWKAQAKVSIEETPDILAEMNRLITLGFKPLDALHIACASALTCQYFLTVDKGILNKAACVTTITLINPVDFIMLWEEHHDG